MKIIGRILAGLTIAAVAAFFGVPVVGVVVGAVVVFA